MKRLAIPAFLLVVVASISLAGVFQSRFDGHTTPTGDVVQVDDRGVAAGGYDVVAYFDGVATPGTEAFETTHRGAKYRFGSRANLETFRSDPEAYAPQYGGFCAWAVGEKASLVEADPEVFSVVDGRLFLNFNRDVQQAWETDRDDLIRRGDGHWPTIVRDHT